MIQALATAYVTAFSTSPIAFPFAPTASSSPRFAAFMRDADATRDAAPSEWEKYMANRGQADFDAAEAEYRKVRFVHRIAQK